MIASYIEKPEVVVAMQWKGIDSMSELVAMRDESMVNILLRHDESILIFDNAFNLSVYVTLNVGDYYIKDTHGNFTVMDGHTFEETYLEVK